MFYGTVLALVESIQVALQNRMTAFQVKQLCWSIVCVTVTELGLKVSTQWLHCNFFAHEVTTQFDFGGHYRQLDIDCGVQNEWPLAALGR